MRRTKRGAAGRRRNEPPRSGPDKAFAEAVAHLEYLGYKTDSPEDGWTFARHPFRYDFHLQMFPVGIRLYSRAGIGAATDNSREAWLEFLNGANNRSFLTRFSLDGNDAGELWVSMRAMLPAAYDRPTFAVLFDLWQQDLDIVRLKPDFPAETEKEEDESDAAATSIN